MDPLAINGQNNNMQQHQQFERQYVPQPPLQYAPPYGGHNQPQLLQPYMPQPLGHGQYHPLHYAQPHLPPVLPPMQGYHPHFNPPPMPPAPPRAAVPGPPMPPMPPAHPASIARQRPNNEPRPGGTLLHYSSLLPQLTLFVAVFNFQVDVLGGRAKCEFFTETDITWPDFQQRVAVYLGNNTELMYKVTGDTGKGSYLKDSDNFKAAMERLCQRAYHARTRAVALEIRDTAVRS